MSSAASGEVASAELETTWGGIRIECMGGRVTACTLPSLAAEPADELLCIGERYCAVDACDRRALEEGVAFVRSTLDGKEGVSPDIRFPDAATPFSRRVWACLLQIPRGTTMQYGEVALAIGRPGGARAVGRACGVNPLPLFVPCHRVLPRDGGLGGFSCGLLWKRLLLEREGTVLTSALRRRELLV